MSHFRLRLRKTCLFRHCNANGIRARCAVLKLNAPPPISMAALLKEKLSAAETYPLLVVVDGFTPYPSIVLPDDFKEPNTFKDRRWCS